VPAVPKAGDGGGRQPRAGRVNGGGVTGGARADNQDFCISQNVLLIESQGKYSRPQGCNSTAICGAGKH